MSDDKTALRRHYRTQRAQLSHGQREAATLAIADHLERLLAKRPPTRLFAYRSLPGEAALDAWLDVTPYPRALPRVENAQRMRFHVWSPGEPLVTSKLGIAEPLRTAQQATPGDADVLLVPLVAYDTLGTRLGMGGGFYDRYLAELKTQPRRVGVAFACQQHNAALPREAWDVSLHAVVTETGVLEFDST